MSIHDGHRQRMKAKFLQSGLENFDSHNILEILLYYALPRSDTNEVAHNLINRFGSLSAVFDAPIEELCKVGGLSEHSAILIKLVPEIYSAYSIDKLKNIKTIKTSKEAGEYFVPRFAAKTTEEVWIALLDDKYNIVKCVKVGLGNVNSTRISVKNIIAETTKSGATNVMIRHNHPAGVALPSKDDISLTEKINLALKLVDVKLLDHIIVADGDYYSMADNSKLDIFK